MISTKPNEGIEIAFDDAKEILAVGECGGETTDNLKRINLKRISVLNADDEENKDEEDENQPLPSFSLKQPCKNTSLQIPDPSTWPQQPLMIRPTPNSSTKVIGIRRARKKEYENFVGLPINNGREVEGDSLVIDFESTNFVGSLLLRIKDAPPISRRNKNKEDHYGQESYFTNRKRRFQAVIKGKFKKPLPMSDCVTGQVFERPAGKLPGKWVVKQLIRFFTILAPQLDASLDGNKPRFLSPLVATAHTVLSEDEDEHPSDRNSIDSSLRLKQRDRHLDLDVEADLQEPHSLDSSSVLSSLATNTDLGITIPDTTSFSATNRSLTRKKIFNSLSANRTPEPRFDTDKIYTFEFYQHLLDFGDELALDMGRIGGMIPLAQALDGQPLKIMAAYRSGEVGDDLEPLWSFDIFHESLYSYVQMAGDRLGTEEFSSMNQEKQDCFVNQKI